MSVQSWILKKIGIDKKVAHEVKTHIIIFFNIEI